MQLLADGDDSMDVKSDATDNHDETFVPSPTALAAAAAEKRKPIVKRRKK